MPGDNFTFVGLSGQADVDTRATNKLVRSHVMRRYKRQKKATSPRQKRSPTSAEEESISGSWSTGDVATWTPYPDVDTCQEENTESGQLIPFQGSLLGSQDIAINAQQSISTSYSRSGYIQTWLDGALDPFSSFPIHMDDRSLMLLQRNASSPLRTSVHAYPIGIYKRTCSKDPAWLSMHLYYAACRFPRSSNGHNYEATQFLLQSETAVSKSIKGSPSIIEDSTIATVSCLANIENLNGEASTAYIHIEGLKRMVQLRGGLSKLGMRGILRRMVLWSDLLTSLNLKMVPHFPFTPTEYPSELWEFIPPFARENYYLISNPELDTITTQKHNINISYVLLSMHQLSTFLNSVGDGLLPWDACYPDRVYEVEQSIALALHDDFVVAEDDDKVEMGQLLLQAALLFIYSNLRQTPVGGTIRKTLLSRLRGLLEGMDLAYYFTRFAAEMLWVLTIGIFAASGAEQAWFLDKTGCLCVGSQVGGWSEVKGRLKTMPTLLDASLAACTSMWVST